MNDPRILVTGASGSTGRETVRVLHGGGHTVRALVHREDARTDTLRDLGEDAVRVLDAVGATRAHVCGSSLGGLTAMWLGLHASARVDRLVGRPVG